MLPFFKGLIFSWFCRACFHFIPPNSPRRPREMTGFVKKNRDPSEIGIRKNEILAENCWWSGDILSLRPHRANQYYICTWYIHWIITSNIVTLLQQRGKRQSEVLILRAPPTQMFAPKFLQQRARKKGVLQQNFKKKILARAVAPQMSNGFWYPTSFVPNKFALDPFLYPPQN